MSKNNGTGQPQKQPPAGVTLTLDEKGQVGMLMHGITPQQAMALLFEGAVKIASGAVQMRKPPLIQKASGVLANKLKKMGGR
jgi:hypothetical protein